MTNPHNMSLESWVVAGGRPDQPGQPLNTPPMTASNFRSGGDRSYARGAGTDTIASLEELVGGMENGIGLAFSSGMAAVAAVFDGVRSGSTVAIPDDTYHGVTDLALDGEARGRWNVQQLPTRDATAWVKAAAEADLVWLESPSNPLLEVADLPAICAAPRKPGNTIAVDNTFATSFNQRPLEFGADVSMHSATKFIGGHSDLLAGVLVTSSQQLDAQLRRSRMLTGALPGALESYLAVRGARTMAIRMDQAQGNATVLAERLEACAGVETVRYPGLSSHPDHQIAARVLDGFGTMISFDVVGDAERADAVLAALKLVVHATSLGSVESTMERRAVIPGQEHLPPTLLRLSVGCENVEDIWSDLAQALR